MRKTALLLPLLLLASPALAHDGHGAASGLAAGLMHPLSGMDHMAAMLAAGLAASSFGRMKAGWLALAFLGAMAGGFGLARLGLSLPAAEGVILLSGFVLAAMALFPQRYVASLALVAGFAIFHGHAHGVEAGGDPAGFAIGFLVASASLIGTGFAVGRLWRARNPGLLPTIR